MGYNIKQKIEICLKAESNPSMTQGELAQWAMEQYGSEKAPSQTTISRILSSKNELIASKSADFLLVRRRKQLNPLLRRILTEWITQALWVGIPITTPIIQLTAHAIWTRLPMNEKDGNGVFSQKWCNHFIKKLNANLRGDDFDSMKNPGNYPLNKVWKLDEKLELKDYLKKLIELENYAPQDIFTLDEFQIFYSLPLDQIFDVSSIDKGLRQSSSSTENLVTIMLGTNIDGLEKLTPLIVGKYDTFDVTKSSQLPLTKLNEHQHHENGNGSGSNSTSSGSSGSAHNNTNTLMNKLTDVYNLYYKSNSNKWITSSMFQNYLLTLEHKLANHSPGRKIVILLDDSSSHRIINLKFSNIKLCYLKNESNHKNSSNSSVFNGVKFDYLPMSFGIIEEFKILYRLQQYLEMINIQRNMAKRNERGENENGHSKDGIDTKSNSPITTSSISQYKPDPSPTSTLSEADYDIPFIRVIEWIKRSWDSISSELIFLSWKKTHLINFTTQPWPTSDPMVAMRAKESLGPMQEKASVYNFSRSYEKLNEIMGYLNVVIPWKIDELLGLVNERGKVTLSYVSIEEIIGSCLLESSDKDKEDESSNAAARTGALPTPATNLTSAPELAVTTALESMAEPNGLISDWNPSVDPQFDMQYEYSNASNSLNINSLLAAAASLPQNSVDLFTKANANNTPNNLFNNSLVTPLSPMPAMTSIHTPGVAASNSTGGNFSQLNYGASNNNNAPYWQSSEKRRKVYPPQKSDPLSTPYEFRSPVKIPPMFNSKALTEVPTENLNGSSIVSKDIQLINSLTKLLDEGDGLQLSSTTLAELRANLNAVKARCSEKS